VFGAEHEIRVRLPYTPGVLIYGTHNAIIITATLGRFIFTVYFSGQKALSVIKTYRGGGVLNAYGRVGAPSILMRFWRRVDAEEGECAMEVVV